MSTAKHRIICLSFFLLAFAAESLYSNFDMGLSGTAQTASKKNKPAVKPYRVLVVIGDQWTDPLSYSIDSKRVKGGEFIDVVTMLKIWGVPFDVLRLDQQRLQINRFLDGGAKPNYGCVIWMADPTRLEGFSANFQTLKRVVEEYGISMIALFDNIKIKQVADLVGMEYQGVSELQSDGSRGRFAISGTHYITSGAVATILPN
jgi:hypothetical protein